jgi:hypothetical protein
MRRALLLLLVSLAGCATVAPWERERLALPGMRFDTDVESAADQHLLESREGSSGAYGSVGGGCGCN